MRRQPAAAVFAALLLFASSTRAQDEDLAVPPLPASPARVVTLAQALAIADREASDLAILRAQVARSEAAERIAWASVLPVISGAASYQRFDEPIVREGVGTVRDENQVGGQLVVSEVLSLRAISAVRIAEAASDTSRLDLEDARRLAHGAIARTYFTVLAARRAAELSRTQAADARRQFEATRARVEAGAAIGLDVARAEVAALDVVRRAADADAALERAWDQLGAALGLDQPVDVADDAAADVPTDLESALADALEQRTDVRAARMAREQAALAVDDAWFRFAPTLSLSWTGTLNFPTTLFNPDPAQWIAAATITVPFYDGGVRYGAVRDAQIALTQADERIEQTQRELRVEVRDAVRRRAIAERNVRIAARQAEVARRAAEASEELYRVGNLTGLELDAARRVAEQAELQRVLAELEEANARVDVLTAIGRL